MPHAHWEGPWGSWRLMPASPGEVCGLEVTVECDGEGVPELKPNLTLPCAVSQQKDWDLIGPDPFAGPQVLARHWVEVLQCSWIRSWVWDLWVQ